MDVDHKNIHGERLGKKQHFLINGQNACNSLVVNWYFINEKDILIGLGKMISIHYIYLKVCLPHLHIEADWTKFWRGLTILISVTFSLHVQDIRVVNSFWSNFFSRDYKLKEIVFKKVIFHNFKEMMSLSFHIDIKIIRNYSQIPVIVLSNTTMIQEMNHRQFYMTPHSALMVCWSDGWSVLLWRFWYLWAFWAYWSCPNVQVTSVTAPDYPYETGVAIYPALLRWL